jgi:hypothetical protein
MCLEEASAVKIRPNQGLDAGRVRLVCIRSVGRRQERLSVVEMLQSFKSKGLQCSKRVRALLRACGIFRGGHEFKTHLECKSV